MNKKLALNICFRCIIIVLLIIVILLPKKVSEKKALDILSEYELNLDSEITNFQIFGTAYNGIINIAGEDYYKFSFMEKESDNSQGSYIAYNFVVSLDGKKVYKYNVIEDEYIVLFKKKE